MSRRYVLGIGVVVAAVAVFGFWYFRSGSRAHIPAGAAVSIDIAVSEPRDQPLVTITNGQALARVMQVLRSGRPAKPHSCTARGTMEVRFTDGKVLSVAFGPGHDLSLYEFGMDGHLFTVPRSRLFETLSSAGIDVQKIPTN